jgi:hypothetical protein
MNALVTDLTQSVPEERHPTLRYWDARLKATIARLFTAAEERLEALKEDLQGLGILGKSIPELLVSSARCYDLGLDRNSQVHTMMTADAATINSAQINVT